MIAKILLFSPSIPGKELILHFTLVENKRGFMQSKKFNILLTKLLRLHKRLNKSRLELGKKMGRKINYCQKKLQNIWFI